MAMFLLFTSFFGLYLGAHAFSFSIASAPAQCSNLTLNWSGGTPPYEITLLPFQPQGYGFTEPLSVIDANTSATSWSRLLPYPENAQFVIVLSDSSGFGTGGTSDVYIVANGSSSCFPTASASTNFTFYTDPSTPVQCKNMQFYGFNVYGYARPPVVVSAVIPGGNSFDYPPNPEGDWHSEGYMMDVKEGTQIAFMVSDSAGRATGGTSRHLMEVQSGNSSCLSGSSPASTAAPAAGAINTSAVSSVSSSSSSSGRPSSTGAIVGGVIGGVVALILLAAVLVFLLRRRRRALSKESEDLRLQEIRSVPTDTRSKLDRKEKAGDRHIHEIRFFPNDSDSVLDGKGKQSFAQLDD